MATAIPQTKTQTITITDTTKPIITLTGDNPQTIELGKGYTELQATAADLVDDDAELTRRIVIAGTVDTSEVGTYSITYDVSDTANNAAESVTRIVNVIDTTTLVITRNPELALAMSPDQMYTVGRPIDTLVLPEADGGIDPLSYMLVPNIPGLNFDADTATRTLTGTPTAVVTTMLTYTATDTNNATTTAAFTITVNPAPTLTTPPDQMYTVGRPIDTLNLPEADGGTGPLSYTLMPNIPGLNFDAVARTLMGTPTTKAEATTLTYTATDTNNATTTATFTVAVNDGLSLAAIHNQTYTMGIAIHPLELPVATGGTAPIAYALAMSVPGLSFDTGMRILTGTPGTMMEATELTYMATDDNGATAEMIFTVTVTDPAGVATNRRQPTTPDPNLAGPARDGADHGRPYDERDCAAR